MQRSLLLTALAAAAAAHAIPSSSSARPHARQSSGYTDPTQNGGRLLTYIPNFPSNIGEPINLIISGASDPYIRTTAGFLEWADSVQLLPNACVVRDNLGGAQQANLGDGNGRRNQSDVLRYSYWTDNTCSQSINGGNHARYWRQNGTQADTGAWFLAASVEMAIAQNHMIVDNGYDRGRDEIVGNATQSNGTLSTNGYVFQSTLSNVPLLSSVAISDINHQIATDGNVAVLTVRLISNGTSPSTNGTASGGNNNNGGAGAGSGSPRSVAQLSLPALAFLAASTLGAVALLV